MKAPRPHPAPDSTPTTARPLAVGPPSWRAAAHAGRAKDRAEAAQLAALTAGVAEEYREGAGPGTEAAHARAALEKARLAARLSGEARDEAEAARREAQGLADRLAEAYDFPADPPAGE